MPFVRLRLLEQTYQHQRAFPFQEIPLPLFPVAIIGDEIEQIVLDLKSRHRERSRNEGTAPGRCRRAFRSGPPLSSGRSRRANTFSAKPY